MVVRELIARFGVKFDKKGADRADKSINKLIKGAGILAAALAAAVVVRGLKNIVVQTAAVADAIDKTSLRLGVNAQRLQELQFAANLAGASNQDLASGMRILAKNVDEAAGGSKEFADDFKRLGVRLKDTNGELRPLEDIFLDVGDGLRNLKTDTERTALAQKALGRGGAALVPLFKQGSEVIREQGKEARALGLIDEELIGLGVEFTDNQTRLGVAFQGVRAAIAKALLPAVIKIQKAMVVFFKANGALIRQKLGAVFKGIASAIRRISGFFIDAASAVGRWLTSLGPIQKGILAITAIVLGLIAIIFLPGVALVALGLLVLALIDDFQTWREGGKSVIGDLIAAIGGFLDQFPLIKDALISIKDFFVVVFETIRDVVFSFVQFFIDLFTVGPLEAIQKFGRNLIMAYQNWFDLIGGIIQTAVDFWKDLIFGFVSSVVDKITGVGRKVTGFVKGLFGGGDEEMPAGAAPARALAQIAGGGAMIAAPVARPLGGGAAAATVNQRTSVEINITGAAAADDPARLADELGRRIEEVNERDRRQAQLTFTPAVAGT